MAAAGATEVVDLGADDSSRSPSPSSDAIDGDNAGGSDYEPTSVARPSVTSTRQQQQQQRTGAGGRPNRAGAAAAAAAAAAGSPTKRKMPAAKDRQIGPEDYEDFTAGGHAQQQEGASGSNGADPREGRNAAAAYGRLLDLDYPRDYGDVFARFDAAMAQQSQQQQQQAGQAMPANISPTIPMSAAMHNTISESSTASDRVAGNGAGASDGEKMETDA